MPWVAQGRWRIFDELRTYHEYFHSCDIEGGQWFFEGLGCGDLRIRDQSCSSVVVKYRYV